MEHIHNNLMKLDLVTVLISLNHRVLYGVEQELILNRSRMDVNSILQVPNSKE
jgi:hypothetical protein